MAQSTLSRVLEKELALSPLKAKHIEKTWLDAFAAELKREQTLSIYGFGRFMIQRRPARNGLNPRTGERIKIPATATVRFKASPTLRIAAAGLKAVASGPLAAKAAKMAAETKAAKAETKATRIAKAAKATAPASKIAKPIGKATKLAGNGTIAPPARRGRPPKSSYVTG